MKNIATGLVALFAAAMLFAGCTVPEKPSAAPTPTPRKMTEFEREIKAMKTAKFEYIFVFRRKDGGVLNDEDKQFIREKAHYATNRFSLSKDGTTVFAGSNFKFDDDSLNDLKERFDFQDFSKPTGEPAEDQGPAANSNSNRNGAAPQPDRRRTQR